MSLFMRETHLRHGIPGQEELRVLDPVSQPFGRIREMAGDDLLMRNAGKRRSYPAFSPRDARNQVAGRAVVGDESLRPPHLQLIGLAAAGRKSTEGDKEDQPAHRGSTMKAMAVRSVVKAKPAPNNMPHSARKRVRPAPVAINCR